MALTDLTRISTSGIATGTSLSGAILHGDAHFRGTQIGVTSALFDSSDNALEFNDNVKLTFGNDGDLKLYHNGSHSYIDETGMGNLYIRNGTKNSIWCKSDGQVNLYFNDVKKFETTQTGAVVTGILTASKFSGSLVGNTSNASGISTFYDLRVSNNLTVEGTTTTLDTNLIGVDRVEVGANSNSIVGVAVTQSGTADIVRLYDGATQRVTVDDQGRVGIGSDIPVAHLDVSNYQNIEVLRLRDRHFNKYLTIRGGGSPNRMIIDSYEGGGGGADIDLASNGSTKIRIRSTGYVGINTTGLYPLDVLEPTNNAGLISITGANTGYDTGFLIRNGSNAKWYLINDVNGSGGHSFEIRGDGWSNDRFLTLTQTGNMGLGDTAPPNFTGYKSLSIHGSTGGALVFGDDGTDEWEIYGGDGVLKVYDRTNTSERLRIDANGDLNLGANPTNQYGYKLNIQDSAVIYAQTASSGGLEAKWHIDNSAALMEFGTVTSDDLGLVANNKVKVHINRSYARVGINTNTFDTAGSQLKIEGRGTSTTSPPYLQIKGVGNSNLHAYVDLVATSDSNAGNAYRGLGVVMHDEPTNVEWFSGRPYAGSDKFIIGRKASPSYRTQSSEVANQFFQITSAGKVGINQSTPTAELEVAPNGTGTTSTIFIHAPTHNTNVASEAILKFGYGHSGSPDGEGYIKMVEDATNSFDADFRIGLPTNNNSGGSTTNERLRITSEGNIGIGGITNPQEKVQIAGGNISLGNRSDGASRYIGKGTNGSGGVMGDSSANPNSGWIGFVSGSGTGAEDQIRFGTLKSGTSGGERMRLDGLGRLSIGAALGSHNDNSELIKIQQNTASAILSIIGSNDTHSTLALGDEDDFNRARIRADHTHDLLGFWTADAERLRITDKGVLSSFLTTTGGNNTGNAYYHRPVLEITHNSGTPPTQVKILTNISYTGDGTHAHSVTIRGFRYGGRDTVDIQICWHVYAGQFYNRVATSSGSYAPTITLAVESGKVVIHLTNPGYWPKFYVESLYHPYGSKEQAEGWSWTDNAVNGDSGLPVNTVPYKWDAGGLSFNDSHNNNGQGDLTIGDGNLILASGHGINFGNTANGSGATGISELLDDYEFGDFTPTIHTNTNKNSTSGENSSHTGAGQYVKVGKMVTVTVDFNALHTNARNHVCRYISGLPFTSRSNNKTTAVIGYQRGLHFVYGSDVFSNQAGRYHTLYGYIGGNSTNLQLNGSMAYTPYSGWPATHDSSSSQYMRITISYFTS